MKIIMLGSSAVGKTTVMMSTYGMMSTQNQFHGFNIRSQSEQAHKSLVNAYRAFKTKGRYPEATTRMESYEYDFSVDGKKIMSFTLLDIRGESIHDYDNRALLNELTDSDVVMLFFNGEDVMNNEDLEEDYFDLFSLLNTAFASDSKQRMLMPVITQMDRFLPIDDSIVEKLLEFCKPMKQMDDKNDSLSYQMVPTACSRKCMMNLDFLMVQLMLFGYGKDVESKRDALEAEINELKTKWDESLGILDLVGLDSKRNNVRKRLKELEPIIEMYDNVMVPIYNKMLQFLKDYDLFSYISFVEDNGVDNIDKGSMWDL